MVEHLTNEQIGDFKKLYDEIDTDKDGKVTLEEIKAGCETWNIPIPKEELQHITIAPKMKDPFTLDEGITFPEFLVSVAKDDPDVDKIADEIITAFRVFDHDGTGMITLTEIKHVLTNMGQKFTEEEIEEMFAAAGISEETSINYADFVQAALHK